MQSQDLGGRGRRITTSLRLVWHVQPARAVSNKNRNKARARERKRESKDRLVAAGWRLSTREHIECPSQQWSIFLYGERDRRPTGLTALRSKAHSALHSLFLPLYLSCSWLCSKCKGWRIQEAARVDSSASVGCPLILVEIRSHFVA